MIKHKGKILGEQGDYKIIQCTSCNFIHLNPIPTNDTLLEMYEKEYYQKVKPDYITKDESELNYWNLSFDERLDFLEKNIEKNRRILDIGCGAGFFLSRAKSRGWDVVGIEPSKIPAVYAENNGLTIIQDFFEKIDLVKIGKFNSIHMKFFLEHSSSPNKILEICNSILEKNGILIIEVPNDFNPLQIAAQKSLKEKQYWIATPDHINYFNFKSFEKILNKNGFDLIKKESTFPLELFLLMGNNYLNNSNIGKEKHNERMNLEMNLSQTGNNDIKKKMYQSFAEMGIGRTAIVFAKKTS